jgi:hypothetical protein
VFSQSDISYGSQSVYVHSESREYIPAVQSAEPELHLRFDGDIKDVSRSCIFWIFGFDDEKEEKKHCNVFLGIKKEIRRNRKKINYTHFRIFFNFESGSLML